MRCLFLSALGILFAISLSLLNACSADQRGGANQEFLKDAKQFCSAFSPKVWAELRQRYQGAELMQEFMKRIDTAVTTPEFEEIMNRQHTVEKSPSALYQYYVSEVSELTGQDFSCEDLRFYFEETLR